MKKLKIQIVNKKINLMHLQQYIIFNVSLKTLSDVSLQREYKRFKNSNDMVLKQQKIKKNIVLVNNLLYANIKD